MSKKEQVKRMGIGVVCGILAIVLVAAGILFVPLKGKAHVEIWSASDEFKLSGLQTVEKQAGKPFRILLITDLQLWSNPFDNREALDDVAREVR